MPYLGIENSNALSSARANGSRPSTSSATDPIAPPFCARWAARRPSAPGNARSRSGIRCTGWSEGTDGCLTIPYRRIILALDFALRRHKMRRLIRILLNSLLSAGLALAAFHPALAQEGGEDAFIANLLPRLTPEVKIGQLF